MQESNEELSYFANYIKAYNAQAYGKNMFMLTPQMLNESIKDLNMISSNFTTEQIRKMVMQPHNCEQELRKLSLRDFQSISLYKQNIQLMSNMLEFDWEPIPYVKDGTPISIQDFGSCEYKKDYAQLSRFFNSFNVKSELQKVLWNMCMYDTYFTSVREYDDHIYLQELPATHSIIDANSYLGYLFSFDLSYFTNSGVDINAFAPSIREKYGRAIRNNEMKYNPNMPSRNGRWVQWIPMSPDDSWCFKFNSEFAGSVPPLLSSLIDYSKIDKYKELEDVKKELEAYKVIFATVPRLSGNKTGNKTDDFAVSSTEMGKFVAAVKETLKNGVDFKAAPLEDFKAFDFSPSASEKNLLNTELKNIMLQNGITDALSMTETVNMASASIYKLFNSKTMSSLYSQFNHFLEYQVNRRMTKYHFKIKCVGTMFDREERIKHADSDMEKGIITPSIFSSRGIQFTDAQNITNMMYSMGFPESFRPIKTASTMSSEEKENGRKKKDESELSDSGAATRTSGSNGTSKGEEVKE